MPTFQKCPAEIHAMARSILEQFESHKPLLDCGVTFSFLFAFGERDEDTGELTGDAITHQGHRALGLCRIVNEKDRVKGNPDAEILLDGDYWTTVDEPEQRALLDHELHHLSVKMPKGIIQHDCAGRPKLKMRKHDVEIGWFKTIAERHGEASQERKQAAQLMEFAGQYFWPQIAPPAPEASGLKVGKSLARSMAGFADTIAKGGGSVTISTGDTSVTIDHESAKRIKRNAEKILAAK